jgi:hypothetical protein
MTDWHRLFGLGVTDYFTDSGMDFITFEFIQRSKSFDGARFFIFSGEIWA